MSSKSGPAAVSEDPPINVPVRSIPNGSRTRPRATIGLWSPRKREPKDVEAMADVIAAVAEEGLIAAEAPVDVAERAEHLRGGIDREGPAALWVLEDRGRIVGAAGVEE